MSGEDYGGHKGLGFEMQPLADGTEVPKPVVTAIMLNLRALSLEEYGEIARIDLAGLAQGRQPTPVPGFDMVSIYHHSGLCSRLDDGSLEMQAQIASVVRNAAHRQSYIAGSGLARRRPLP